MYWIKRMEPQYLVHVKKFVVAVKAHRLSLGRTTSICPCSKCKNMKAHADSEVKSHLIRFSFVNDYMVWTFHGEKAVDATTTTTVADASREKTSSSTMINAEKHRYKGQRESGIRWRNHLSSFLSRRSQFSLGTCHTGQNLIHPMPSIACTWRRMSSIARSASY
jgi:hypothetical protein